jgi:hypothetical protein
MGYAASWIVVRGLEREEFLRRLDLEDSGRRLDWGRGFLLLGDVGGGWLVVCARDCRYATTKLLTEISMGAEALSCQVEEHVMVSKARGFRDGRQVWAATHDPAKGIDSLVIKGAPPTELVTIEADLRAKQIAEGGDDADVDFMFDAPPKIVAALSGYDDGWDQGIVFAELWQRRPPKGPGLFQRLFGRP